MKILNSKKTRVSILLFLSFLIWLTITIFGQNRSTISGFVFDPQRKSIGQIPVELMNEVNSVIQRTKTDGSGRYFFSGLSQGRFSVRVLPIGTDYEEQTQDVEIYGVGITGRNLSDNVQKDFYLRLRKNTIITNSINDVVFVQEVPEDAKRIYEKAASDLDNKNVELGIEELEKALKLFPDYFLVLEKLGIIYIGQQKFEKARDIFNRAVIINPRSFKCWYGLSYVNYSLKQSDLAVEAARKAVSLNANSVEALLFLGVSLRQDKQYEDAEKSLKQADKLAKGKSADVHWNLALLYAHNLMRYNDAANELDLYLRVSPNLPNADSIKKLIKEFRQKSLISN